MNITVTEALRLKNEVNNVLNRLTMSVAHLPVVVRADENTEDDEGDEDDRLDVVIREKETFNRLLFITLPRLQEMSLQLGTLLHRFNIQNDINERVQQIKHNNTYVETLREVMQTMSSQIKQAKMTDRQMRMEASDQTVYLSPVIVLVTKGDIKERIRELRVENRRLQREIDRANAKTIEIGFNYDMFQAICDEAEISVSSDYDF